MFAKSKFRVVCGSNTRNSFGLKTTENPTRDSSTSLVFLCPYMSKAQIFLTHLFCNGESFCDIDEWQTPNTYSGHFGMPPSRPGIYLFSVYVAHDDPGNIVYIGSSNNLLRRYSGHEIKAQLYQHYWYVRYYFKECLDYKKQEKELILKFRPKFNVHHNSRNRFRIID